jgi:hypothetical protein
MNARSPFADYLSSMVRSLTEENAKIFKAGHDAGYAEGYRAAMADARKIVAETAVKNGLQALGK